MGGVDLENEKLFILAGNNGSCWLEVKYIDDLSLLISSVTGIQGSLV